MQHETLSEQQAESLKPLWPLPPVQTTHKYDNRPMTAP
jgi:hypothetical protein